MEIWIILTDFSYKLLYDKQSTLIDMNVSLTFTMTEQKVQF